MTILKTKFNLLFPVAISCLLANCAQNTTATQKTILGTVKYTHPVKTSGNSGVGRVLGGLGGSLGASNNIGSGNGRYASAILGSFIGSQIGTKAEKAIRQKDALGVVVEVNGTTHKLISKSGHPFQVGDKVWATTNSFGVPIAITPR